MLDLNMRDLVKNSTTFYEKIVWPRKKLYKHKICVFI